MKLMTLRKKDKSVAETVSNIDTSQKVNQNFEVDGIKYQLDKEYVNYFSLMISLYTPKIMTP